MTYDVAHWGRIEPRGEDPEAVARSWNDDEELSLYVGDASVYPGGIVRCEGGENGLDRADVTELAMRLSSAFPKALFRLVSEREDFGDFPYVTYVQNGRWYSAPFEPPDFDPRRLTPPETGQEAAPEGAAAERTAAERAHESLRCALSYHEGGTEGTEGFYSITLRPPKPPKPWYETEPLRFEHRTPEGCLANLAFTVGVLGFRGRIDVLGDDDAEGAPFAVIDFGGPGKTEVRRR